MLTCVITGASQGIGRATAIEMSHDRNIGNIVLISRNEQQLLQTKALMDQEGKNIRVIPYDLENLEGIGGLVKGIYEECGGIDLLLNVAGYADPKALLDTTIENFKKTYNVNVFAMFVLIRECVKYMGGKPSKILNVASTAGSTSRPGWLAYATSKAAVIAMSNTLADELAEYKIKVYCISPGRCATELRRILAPEEDPTTIMQPEHVAKFIAHLMSETESCLDGQNIRVRQK